MRKAVLLAAALALSASAAHAQGRDDEDDGWRERREHRAERGRDRDDEHGWREERGGRFGGRGGGGARFFVRSGETRVGVVCDRGESMRSCLDATLMLLDKARQAGSAAPPATTGGSSSPGARP
jgi:hypothetical protein